MKPTPKDHGADDVARASPVRDEPERSEGRTTHAKHGVSLIFAIIAVTALLIVAAQSADLTVRNLKRVDDIWAGDQAELMAESAFGAARQYVETSCADAGCDYLGEYAIEEDVIYGDYEITGLSAQNTDENDGYYYVPIPGRGDAAGKYEYDEDYPCDPETPGDSDEICNWNKIYFGDSVTIPLYQTGEDSFQGDELYVRVRTPVCDEFDADCKLVSDDAEHGYYRKLISCKDETKTATDELNGCDMEDDKVILFWQITGDRDEGTDYVESAEGTKGVLIEVRDPNNDLYGTDSEIYATLINNSLGNDYSSWDSYNEDYVVLNMYDPVNPDWRNGEQNTILDVLTDFTDSMLYPALHIFYVETIRNNDGAIPYLEYQVVSDVQISNDRSFISARGFVKSKGDSYFWLKDGWLTNYTASYSPFAIMN